MPKTEKKTFKKLHLGCGQIYLEGYVNIDFPLEHHSVQVKSVADKQANILQLSYAPGSIEEVRLHHLFEHFPRTTYCALLAGWREWLDKDGTVRIEVPNFEKMARIAISRLSSRNKKRVALRHVFGSNEEAWAVHYEGWSKELFEEVFSMLGYEIVSIKRSSWRGTHNLDITARKTRAKLSSRTARDRVRTYLSSFLVDQKDEKDLLAVWMKQYDEQLALTCKKSRK